MERRTEAFPAAKRLAVPLAVKPADPYGDPPTRDAPAPVWKPPTCA